MTITHTMNTLTGLTTTSVLRANYRSLRTLLAQTDATSHAMRSRRPVERLDDIQLGRLIAELETGRYRISPAHWYRLRDLRFQAETQEFSNRLMRNARTADENRYDEENAPLPPTCSRSSSGSANQIVGLEDGRLARRLDLSRALPLCGLRVPVVLSEIEQRANAHDGMSRVRWITGSRQCARCGGFHLSHHDAESTPAAPVAHPEAELTCPHCHGTSLDATREGMVLTLHCLCGWHAFTSLLNLDEATVAQNTQRVLAAPVRDVDDEDVYSSLTTDWTGMAERVVTEEMADSEEDQFDESEEGDLVEALVGMTEDTEGSEGSDGSSSTASDLLLKETEAMEDAEALLVRSLVGFWSSKEQIALRRLLLDRTMSGVLAPTSELSASTDRLALIWTVAALLTESCARFSDREMQDFVNWLSQSRDAELRMFLPDGLQEMPLPNAYAKIRSWMRSCAQRVRGFRSRAAGVRMLAPKFGVSERAFARAVELIA
ncbi:MAG: hypothetical protein KGS09_19935 [Nitrospirae bacterium]|nr:hypothetical protein [Nitrospirota bacterium]